jgi:hypothetical protein
VSGDQKEPQRVLGFPVGSARRGVVQDEEQRVLGMPVRWLEPIGRDAGRAGRSLARLIKAAKALLRKGQ